MDIYVGNLPYPATEEDVSDLFATYGPVERVNASEPKKAKPGGFRPSGGGGGDW